MRHIFDYVPEQSSIPYPKKRTVRQNIALLSHIVFSDRLKNPAGCQLVTVQNSDLPGTSQNRAERTDSEGCPAVSARTGTGNVALSDKGHVTTPPLPDSRCVRSGDTSEEV